MRRPLLVPSGRAAALFVDLQEEHRRDRRYLVEGYEQVLANARELQAAARRAGIAVCHCAYVVDAGAGDMPRFHPLTSDGVSAFSDRNSAWLDFCPEVAPLDGELALVKSQASAFGDGRLAQALSGVEWLFVAGVWSEACVDATVKDATGRGFRVVLVKDACGSGTAAMHQTAILNLANRLYGGAVVSTAEALRAMGGAAANAWVVEGAVPLRFTFESAAALYDEL